MILSYLVRPQSYERRKKTIELKSVIRSLRFTIIGSSRCFSPAFVCFPASWLPFFLDAARYVFKKRQPICSPFKQNQFGL